MNLTNYAIYGAGRNGEILFNAAKSSEIHISFFIDDFSDKKFFCGLPVMNSEKAERNAKIFISIFQDSAGNSCSKKIQEFLLSKKFYRVYTFEEVIYILPQVCRFFSYKNYLWMRENLSETLNEKKLKSVKQLLSDKKSTELFEKIILFRQNLSPAHYPHPENTIQYFPEDVPLFKSINSLRMIDGGSFTGDTIFHTLNVFKRFQKSISTIIAFEPDHHNRSILNNNLKQKQQEWENTKIILFPCALWDSYKVLNFSSELTGSQSSIDEKGKKNEVIGVSLDETVYGFKPNYIKLDVEGAEKQTLKGARQIIADYSPCLAICLYHRPEDLWEIPLLIHQIKPDYNMYIRIYGHIGIELVLYCIPKNHQFSQHK